MPGIHAAAAAAAAPTIASPAPFLALIDDDDDGFGDFKFVSSPQPFPPHQPPPRPRPRQQQQDDDDWGEFFVSPVGSRAFEIPPPQLLLFDAFPSLPAPADGKIADAKQWEKPRGALPLSIFGEEMEEAAADEPEPLSPPVLFSPSFASSSPAKDRKGSVTADGELRDLITSLYDQPPQPVGGNKTGPFLAEGDEEDDDSDTSPWEFKDASSSSPNSVLKEDGMQEENSGFESIAAVDFSKVEVIRIGSGDHKGAKNWISVGSGGQNVSYGTNGAGFVSDATSPKDLDVHGEIRNTPNGDDWFSSLANGEKRGEEELWEFNDFLENKVVTTSGQESHEEQKIQDAESKVLEPTNETEVTSSMWETNLVDWPINAYNNIKGLDIISFNDQNGFSFESTLMGNNILSSPSDGLKNDILDLFIEVDQKDVVWPAKDATKMGQNSDMVNSVYGDCDLGETQWAFLKTSEVAVSNQGSAFEIDKNHSTNLTYNSVEDLYRRLKDGSTSLLNCHLNDLKKACEVASLSGEQVKQMEISEEIKLAYEKLEEVKGIGNANMGVHLPKDICVCQLLEAVEDPNFGAFEQEYQLSERILSAGKKLSAAIELLEHTTSVLHILALASREGQHAYIHAWSDMAVACAQELRHGAMILQESIQVQTFMQIIHHGVKYFVALGEIYRVTEVLRASLKVYKPWILLNCGGSSKLLTSLDECAEAWTLSGLEQALKTISNANDVEHAGLAKALLASIEVIHHLKLSHYSYYHDKKICSISLLSMEELQDMKMELWCGKYYFVKLVNLWANRISHDPPQLPYLIIG